VDKDGTVFGGMLREIHTTGTKTGVSLLLNTQEKSAGKRGRPRGGAKGIRRKIVSTSLG